MTDKAQKPHPISLKQYRRKLKDKGNTLSKKIVNNLGIKLLEKEIAQLIKINKAQQVIIKKKDEEIILLKQKALGQGLLNPYDYQKINDSSDTLDGQIVALNSHIVKNAQANSLQQQNSQYAQKQIEQLTQQKEKLEQENQENTKQLELLNKQLKSQKEEGAKQQKEFASQSTELEGQKEELQKHSKLNQDLQSQVEQLNQLNGELAKEIKQKTTLVEEQGKKIAANAEELKNLQLQLTQNEEFDKYKLQINEFEQKLKETNELLMRREQELEALNKQLENQQNIIFEKSKDDDGGEDDCEQETNFDESQSFYSEGKYYPQNIFDFENNEEFQSFEAEFGDLPSQLDELNDCKKQLEEYKIQKKNLEEVVISLKSQLEKYDDEFQDAIDVDFESLDQYLGLSGQSIPDAIKQENIALKIQIQDLGLQIAELNLGVSQLTQQVSTHNQLYEARSITSDDIDVDKVDDGEDFDDNSQGGFTYGGKSAGYEGELQLEDLELMGNRSASQLDYYEQEDFDSQDEGVTDSEWQLNAKNVQLRNQINDLTLQINAVYQNAVQQELEKEGLRQKLEEFTAKEREWQNWINETEQKNTELRDQLDSVENAVAKRQAQEIANLKKQVIVLSKQAKELEDLKSVQYELEQRLKDEYRKKFEEWCESNNQFTDSHFEEQNNKIAKLEKNFKSANEGLQTEKDFMLQRDSEYQKQQAELLGQLNKLQEELNSANEKKCDLEKKNKEFEEEQNALVKLAKQQYHKEHEEQLQLLQDQLLQLSQKNALLESKNAELELWCDTAMEKIQELGGEVEAPVDD